MRRVGLSLPVRSQISRLEAPGIMAFEVEKNRKKKPEGASLKSCGRSMVPCTPEKEKHPFWVSGAILISTSLLQIYVLVESFPLRQ